MCAVWREVFKIPPLGCIPDGLFLSPELLLKATLFCPLSSVFQGSVYTSRCLRSAATSLQRLNFVSPKFRAEPRFSSASISRRHHKVPVLREQGNIVLRANQQGKTCFQRRPLVRGGLPLPAAGFCHKEKSLHRAWTYIIGKTTPSSFFPPLPSQLLLYSRSIVSTSSPSTGPGSQWHFQVQNPSTLS